MPVPPLHHRKLASAAMSTCISSSSSPPLAGVVGERLEKQPPQRQEEIDIVKGGIRSTEDNSVGDEYSSVRNPRVVAQQLVCERQTLGEGFAFRRSIGRPELECLDPFLTLDEFEFSQPAGFPDHPHRGFETMTYMLEGGFRYDDFSGHKGTINTGDVQWMTAGRGVVHAEMPAGEGVQRGLNFWINLCSKDKMVEPRYQELASEDIPVTERDGVAAKVIAGEALGARSSLQTRTPAMCVDFTMGPGARLRQPVPAGWSACAYVMDGEGVFGTDGATVGAHQCAVFGDGDGVGVRNEWGGPLRFLLVAARPHGEAVVREGPFVMNTREEVEAAREDYRARRNGFEMAKNWRSESQAVLLGS